MKRLFPIHLLCSILLLFCSCSAQRDWVWNSNLSCMNQKEDKIRWIVDQVQAQRIKDARASSLSITYPYNESLFPRDIAAPLFTWNDSNPDSQIWLLAFHFNNQQKPIYVLADKTSWMPGKDLWEWIKTNSIAEPVDILITGIRDIETATVTSHDRIIFATSADSVEAAIFFRQVPLPFSTKNFNQMKWCIGDISSYEKPTGVMKDLPICASCHIFSRDGRTIQHGDELWERQWRPICCTGRKKHPSSKKNFISWNTIHGPAFFQKAEACLPKCLPAELYRQLSE
jgi:hypothetical protein